MNVNLWHCKIKKTKLEGKSTLLSTTIDSLTRDIEKVKLLSESELIANPC
uniref:Uncharacterized protein n=1 Tax=Arion vulgaris TaxID=1028688 RepID=A0A0B6ZJ57_9EUPU